MSTSYRLLLISTILIVFIAQINGGYWICDWVNGRGWMYCSRGYCNSFGKKRSIETNDKQTIPTQNNDGTYCLNKKFCYVCQPIDDNHCYLTYSKDSSHNINPISIEKRANDDLCS